MSNDTVVLTTRLDILIQRRARQLSLPKAQRRDIEGINNAINRIRQWLRELQ
jgi:hypothetical protein